MRVEYHGSFTDSEMLDIERRYLASAGDTSKPLPEVVHIIDARTMSMIKKIGVSPQAYLKALKPDEAKP